MSNDENKTDESEILDLAEMEKVSGTDTSYSIDGFTDKSRDSYRLPANKEDTVAVTVDGTSYELLDIGSRGLGIYLDNPDVFKVDDSSHAIVIRLKDDHLELAGRVVHVSGDGGDRFICGIEIVEMDEAAEQAMFTFIQNRRKNAFEE